MIHVHDDECAPMVANLLSAWENRKRKYYYGDADFQRTIETMGVRGELAFAKRLHALGIEHIHNNDIDKCDFDVYHGGRVHLIDVKTVNVFSKRGSPCRFLFLPRGDKVERMAREGWRIVVAAVCGDCVWLSQSIPAGSLKWERPDERYIKSYREDKHLNVCCLLESFVWECGGWGTVAKQAAELSRIP
jgi:hypothetical protein